MSIASQHTPWEVDGPPDNQIVWAANGDRVCFLAHSNGIDDARDLATGRLIAASPDLLEAAQEAEKLIEDMARFVGQMALKDYALFNEAPIKLRAAIAKAVSQ